LQGGGRRVRQFCFAAVRVMLRDDEAAQAAGRRVVATARWRG